MGSAPPTGSCRLFGTTVVLPGIGDVRTLEALSALAGEEEVRTRSVSAPVPSARGVGAVLARLVLGPRAQRGEQVPTVTTSTVMRRRLPVDVVARGETGMALVVDERNRMGWVRLTPWFATEPWRSAALGPEHRARGGPVRARAATGPVLDRECRGGARHGSRRSLTGRGLFQAGPPGGRKSRWKEVPSLLPHP